jgi:hypothetical protein
MRLLKKLFIKITKIIFKHLLIYVLIAYTPLTFSDIINFYNSDSDSDSFEFSDNDDNDKNFEKKIFYLKLIALSLGLIFIFYIIYTNNPDSAAALKNTKASKLYKMQQDKILENRLNNALLTTKKILEIKKGNS